MGESVATVCRAGATHVKLHHLQVLRDTPLAKAYREGRVATFTREDYLRFLAWLLPQIPATVTIHRLFATCHPELLLAPFWGEQAAPLGDSLRRMMDAAGTWQGQRAG
jgi:hypothetical protein